MPGPLSTPKFWGKDKRNTTGNHGIRPNAARQSGKTAYDHASGKWQNHIANGIINADNGWCHPGSEK